MATFHQIQKMRTALKGKRVERIVDCYICRKATTVVVDVDTNKAECQECKGSVPIPNKLWATLAKQLREKGIEI